MEWISIKDRLPNGERVLIYASNGWISTGYFEDPFWDNTHGDELGENVTYWMPLPEPPKE